MDISELKRNQQTAINRHPWEIARLKVIQLLLKRHFKSIHHIVDIGCGDGYIIKELQRQDVADHYTAVDNAFTPEQLIAFKAATGGTIKFYSSLPNQLASESECILLLDVLEHCEMDSDVLKSIMQNEVFTSNSKFFITVPAFNYVFSQHDVLLGHHRRYSNKEIMKVCTDNNLKIVASGYFFFTLLIIRVLHLLFEKIIGKKRVKSIDNWEGSKGLTKSLSNLLYLDFLLSDLLFKVGIRLPGLSLYCICQR